MCFLNIFDSKTLYIHLKRTKKNCKKRQPHRKNSRNRLDCNNPGRKEKYIILQMLIYECVKKTKSIEQENQC